MKSFMYSTLGRMAARQDFPASLHKQERALEVPSLMNSLSLHGSPVGSLVANREHAENLDVDVLIHQVVIEVRAWHRSRSISTLTFLRQPEISQYVALSSQFRFEGWVFERLVDSTEKTVVRDSS